jgi:hypothetical protein
MLFFLPANLIKLRIVNDVSKAPTIQNEKLKGTLLYDQRFFTVYLIFFFLVFGKHYFFEMQSTHSSFLIFVQRLALLS